ncbi:MAG: hypothetical protein ONB16_10015 [candidate division KSB1 bacterium]|nr:hypothetical protein [candidate division KSB1 bacterium]MDZ7318177.1 hypothetical protein [candidate division KSB1 bacterium]MDZ7340679.1 hypothetical protein [candidate division KSB1 bacterium]
MSYYQKVIYALLVLMIVLASPIAFSQYEPESNRPVGIQLPSRADSIFEPVPPSYWVKFTAFKTVSIIIILLAFLLGFVAFFVGSSAGAKLNRREIRKSITAAMVIAMVARPMSNLAHRWLGLALNYILPEDYAFGIAGFIVYFFWCLYIISIPVFLYESFTVSAKEAHPMG